jgi:hypothetical protein
MVFLLAFEQRKEVKSHTNLLLVSHALRLQFHGFPKAFQPVVLI